MCVHPRLEGNAECRLPLPFCRRRRSPRESGATLTSSTLSWRNVLRRAYCALPARIRRKTFNCAPRVCLSKHTHTHMCDTAVQSINYGCAQAEPSNIRVRIVCSRNACVRACVASVRRVGSAAPSADLVDGQFIYPPPGIRCPSDFINSFQIQPDNDRKTTDKHN